MKTSREQFEEWASSAGHNASRDVRGLYVFSYTATAWIAWQASRKFIEVESPELLTTPVKQFEFERDCQWKEAISKAGIKVKGA